MAKGSILYTFLLSKCVSLQEMTHIFLRHIYIAFNHFPLNFHTGNNSRTDSKRKIPLHVSKKH